MQEAAHGQRDSRRFFMSQETIAGIIFVAMYAVIVSEKIHRTIIAMTGAILMIVMGIITASRMTIRRLRTCQWMRLSNVAWHN